MPDTKADACAYGSDNQDLRTGKAAVLTCHSAFEDAQREQRDKGADKH